MLIQILLIGVSVSMDAFAVSIGKGLTVKKLRGVDAFKTALWFGGFQALFPLLGYFAASTAASTGEQGVQNEDGLIRSGDLVVDTNGYTASLHGHPIDLAYKEFELLKYLVQHPGRVFTRAQLLQEVWGYDYYGGTRTVDVHIRRLRAKLGGEYEHLIGTVRNVGYRFDPPEEDEHEAAAKDAVHDESGES